MNSPDEIKRRQGINQQERFFRHQFFFNAWRALTFNGITGDYAEFGSWGGVTFTISYVESRRQLRRPHMWAFDSFKGLPPQQGAEDEHPMWQPDTLSTSVAQFHQICANGQIPREEYTTIEGFYDETLDKMTAQRYPENIALAYIDCDLYSSTMSVLRFLMPRLKHGMIIAFDDYFCWSTKQLAGERRAMVELLQNHERWHLEPYMRYGWHGKSFFVEDRQLLDSIGK